VLDVDDYIEVNDEEATGWMEYEAGYREAGINESGPYYYCIA
jgi:hypothetical protein